MLLLLATPTEMQPAPSATVEERSYRKTGKKRRTAKAKKRGSSGSGSAKFRSCAEARAAGFTHMRRGQKGYSSNLDRDGDGIACDKVR
jgi:colicin import membrane protein